MQGFWRPKYRDKKTGKERVAKVYWARDPVSGQRVSTGARSLAGAIAWREERERRAANPHYAASTEATIGEWIRKVNALKAERKAAGTAHMYRVKLGHVARIFGAGAPMAAITPESVDRYVEQRQQEASNNTIGKELTAIVQLCKHAKRAGQYAGDISALRPVGFDIQYTPRTAHLEWSQLPALARVLKPHQLAAVKAIVATSARLSEYLTLHASDVDLSRSIVRIRGTKTAGSAREVAVPSLLRPLLVEALPHLERKWVRITHELPEACAAAGIQRLTPNDLRRTHSTWLIEAGVSKDAVSAQLGHTTRAMVDRVYDASEAEARLEVMEAFIGRKARKPRKGRVG